MNILPKKRWHVRTKENIARVRKDEAEAAEKERQEQIRIENADREARLSVLKYKSKRKLQESGIDKTSKAPEKVEEHINLFADLDHALDTTNKDHDKEIKEKKEEYEKKIGYLTYLGQDTNEVLGKKNWYEVLPEASRFTRSDDIKVSYDKLVLRDEDGKSKTKELDVKDGEIAWKRKQQLDPINSFKHLCFKDKKPDKRDSNATQMDYKKVDSYKTNQKSKKKKKDKDEKIQQLREARLRREQQEKHKTEMFLKGLAEPAVTKERESTVHIKPKYNSQFNPELARQNYR